MLEEKNNQLISQLKGIGCSWDQINIQIGKHNNQVSNNTLFKTPNTTLNSSRGKKSPNALVSNEKTRNLSGNRHLSSKSAAKSKSKSPITKQQRHAEKLCALNTKKEMRLAHQRQFIDRMQIQKTLKKKPTIS